MADPKPHKIALVDDDHAVRDSLRFLLELLGHTVEVFGSAAHFLKSDLHDVVCLILDHHMPQMTGLELAERLHARWRQQKTIRKEQLADAERRWQRELPQHGRIALRSERNGYDLRIAELRATGGSLRYNHWRTNGLESNVSLQTIALHVSKRAFTVRDEVLVVVSMHALARWYERTEHIPNADLQRDLVRLVLRHSELMRGPSEFRCDTASGGAWLGQRISTSFANARKSDAKVLSVRTYQAGKTLTGARSWQPSSVVVARL